MACSTVRAKPNILIAEVQGETVLLEPDNGVYFGLNSVGTRIWQLIQRPTPIDELVSVISAEFADATGDITRDVHDFVEALRQSELAECFDE